MKKVKLALWLIFIGFIALIVVQNRDYFLAKQSLGIDLMFTNKYTTPELHNYILLLACFFLGLLVAFLFGISERFRAKKTIRKLHETVDNQHDKIEGLEQQIQKMKLAVVGPEESGISSPEDTQEKENKENTVTTSTTEKA